MAEPGRHFSANTGYLATRVLAKREKNGRNCVHINDSLYHSFNCILMDGVNFENSNDQFYSILKDQNQNQPRSAKNLIYTDSSLFGMTCDGMDVLAKNINLPVDLKVGDWLVFGGMGAYTVGPRSEFNGMKALSRIERWSGEISSEPAAIPSAAAPQEVPSNYSSPSEPFITTVSSSSKSQTGQTSDEESILVRPAATASTQINRN